jgi:hypothetical protein
MKVVDMNWRKGSHMGGGIWGSARCPYSEVARIIARFKNVRMTPFQDYFNMNKTFSSNEVNKNTSA